MDTTDTTRSRLMFWGAVFNVIKLTAFVGCITLFIALAMSGPKSTPDTKQIVFGVACLLSAICFFFAREEAKRFQRLLNARVRVESRR